MWELIKAGGWLMLPLVLCSIAACAIIIERAIRLQRQKVAPANLVDQVLSQVQTDQVSVEYLDQIEQQSTLGKVLVQGVKNAPQGLTYTEQQMQTCANEQIHFLEKNLNFLGTIGAIAPLLGLLGTVIGIIESFLAVSGGGVTDPSMLAAGISQALITTAGGMFVAIPAMIAHRYFQRRILDYSVLIETQSNQLITFLFHKNIQPVYVKAADDMALYDVDGVSA
jgi:biopolymer transport protein ExbB